MLKKYLIENIIFTVKLIFQGGKELQLVKVSYKSEKLVSHSIAGKLILESSNNRLKDSMSFSSNNERVLNLLEKTMNNQIRAISSNNFYNSHRQLILPSNIII